MSPTDSDSPAEAKAAWRRDIRARRRDRVARGDASARARDAMNLATGLFDLAAHLGIDMANGVAIYTSLPTEPPTEALAARLHERAAPMIVPELLPDKDLDWRQLRADGIGDLLGLDAIAHVDLVVVPALAIDPPGGRLGQGGGSYDRALARRRADARVVAFVFADELVDTALPLDRHDQPVDAAVTPSGWRLARRDLGPG